MRILKCDYMSPLYLAEFDHRWNHRHDSDGEQKEAALRKAEAKRLTCKPLVANSNP